jgi:uncharacterized protein DUF7003
VGTVNEVLSVLDRCAQAFTFPMLDNGYVYLAATRLSLHRSAADWAMVIEVFGYSPRAGDPDLHVYTFGSRIHGRERETNGATRTAYRAANPNNESTLFFPIASGARIDGEQVAPSASEVVLRGQPVPLPPIVAYSSHGIVLQSPPSVAIFELCRYLADVHPDGVLATVAERRVHVPPELEQLLVLDDWRHPNLAEDEYPSDVESFRQLSAVLETGDISEYRPSEPSNTHWRHWPEGGLL